MSCKVEGCNRPIYHYNPLVSPLLNFHGKIVTLGSELPRDGKAAEVIKRIGFAVVSPFAYLALAFVALAGLILNGIWENRHVSQSIAMNQNGADFLGTNSTKEEIEVFDTKKDEKGFKIPPGTFGKAEWEKNYPVTIVEVPPLPFNIDEILEQEDPCEPGKKLKETCQLFLRPQKVIFHEEVGDIEITLGFNGAEELAKKAKNPDRRTKYDTFKNFRKAMEQLPVPKSEWVLMRKELIPNSGNKSFEQKQQLLKGNFAVPKLLEAILLNLITFASEGKYLYGTNPMTLTCCQEKYFGDPQSKSHTLVGYFNSMWGLRVGKDGDDWSFGLSGVWKF